VSASLLDQSIGNKGLTTARRSVKEDALGSGNAGSCPKFRETEGHLHKLTDKLNGLATSTDGIITKADLNTGSRATNNNVGSTADDSRDSNVWM